MGATLQSRYFVISFGHDLHNGKKRRNMTWLRSGSPLLLFYGSERSQSISKPINKTFASQKQIQDNTYCIKLQLSSICNVTRSVDRQISFVCRCYTQWPHPNDSTTGNLHDGYTTTRGHCDVFTWLPCPPLEKLRNSYIFPPQWRHYSSDALFRTHVT